MLKLQNEKTHIFFFISIKMSFYFLFVYLVDLFISISKSNKLKRRFQKSDSYPIYSMIAVCHFIMLTINVTCRSFYLFFRSNQIVGAQRRSKRVLYTTQELPKCILLHTNLLIKKLIQNFVD